MTNVQIRFPLRNPLTEAGMARISEIHEIYGILRVVPAASLDALAVDYDASRVSPAEIVAVLRKAGLDVGARE